MTQIDAHQHFWHPSRGDYGWMPPDDPVLTRPYGPQDLIEAWAGTGVAQTVLVQAAPTVAETEYMLGIADASPMVAKVVGWVDFEDPSQFDTLKRLAQHPKFAGVRPMIQDLPDDAWMLRDDVQWAYEALIELHLTFDALGFPRHMAHFHTVLRRYPDLRVVLDHCQKPQIRDHSPDRFATWAEAITHLAENTGAFCKLSGLVTETDGDFSDAALAPYANHVLDAFGPERVMWGSDWPVARTRCSYETWHSQATRLTARLGATAQAEIFGGTAKRFYRIP